MTNSGILKDNLDPPLERNPSPKERTACLKRLLQGHYMENLSVYPSLHTQDWLIWWFVREVGGKIEALGKGREPDLHGFWTGIKRGLFYLIIKLLNCSMRGRSKDFLLERMLGWCLFCFELPDYQKKTAVDLPQWFKPQTFNLFLWTSSCEF